MYDLFETRILVDFSKQNSGEGVSKLTIIREAFYEAANKSHIAFTVSSGHLCLYLYVTGQELIFKQLPWFLYDDPDIKALAFDGSGAWLAAVTQRQMYIVPFIKFLIPSTFTDNLCPTDDVSIVQIPVLTGAVCEVTWWNSFCGKNVAIIGTEKGEIAFIDVKSGLLLHKTIVNGHVTRLQLVPDDRLSVKYLLVTCKSNIQWRVLLEVSDLDLKLRLSVDELHAQGYHGYTSGLFVKSIIAQPASTAEAEEFNPQRFCQFPISASLSSQYVKGRHLISAYDKTDNSLQIYDSTLQHHPLFVHVLSPGLKHILCTDCFIFGLLLSTTHPSPGDAGKVLAVSCTLSERRADAVTAKQTALLKGRDNDAGSVMQCFPLPSEFGRVLRCYRHSHASLWHHELEAATVDDCNMTPAGTSHTIVEGCLLVAEGGILAFKPRVSPEKLFCRLCLEDQTSAAERLGVALNLDVTRLYMAAGNAQLANAHVSHAIRLYQLAKCPPVLRTKKLLEHSHHQEVINYAVPLFESKRGNLSACDRLELYDAVVQSHICLLQQDEVAATSALRSLRAFLLKNENVSQDHLMAVLCKCRLADLLLEVAAEKNFLKAALKYLYEEEALLLVNFGLHSKAQNFFTAVDEAAVDGAIAAFLEPDDLAQLMIAKRDVDLRSVCQLEERLSKLSGSCLLQLARAYDPSACRVRRHALRISSVFSRRDSASRKRLLSSSSSSYGGGGELYEVDDVSQDASFQAPVRHYSERVCSQTKVLATDDRLLSADDLQHLIVFFVKVIIELRVHEPHSCPRLTASRKLMLASQADTEMEAAVCDVLQLAQRRPIACSPRAAYACVDDNTLLVWAHKPPEGVINPSGASEDLVGPPPWRYNFFELMSIKVMNLACGMQHTVVITTAGVYAWGSSLYGQTGVGLVGKDIALPTKLEGFLCVDIVCGHYHTVAVTANKSLFTWGWGIYGQLGLGSCANVSRPTLVAALSSVASAAAGHAHTLALSTQGEVHAFGCTVYGQLGIPGNANVSLAKQTLPAIVSGLRHEPIRIISTGSFHSVAVGASGSLYTWGLHPQVLRRMAQSLRLRRANSSSGLREGGGGELMTVDAFVDMHRQPQKIAWEPPAKVVQIVCGSSHVIALMADGSVYSWGRNIDGQLGTGTRRVSLEESNKPWRMAAFDFICSGNGDGVAYLASSLDCSMALDSLGQVLAWGRSECRLLDSAKGTEAATSSTNATISSSPVVVYSPASAGVITRGMTPASAPSPRVLLTQERIWEDSFYVNRNAQPVDGMSAVLSMCGDESRYSLLTSAAVAKLYPECFPTAAVQSLLASVDAFDAMAAVFLVRGHYPEAMCFHLKSLSACHNHVTASYDDLVLEAIDFYLSLLRSSVDLDEDSKNTVYVRVLGHALHFVVDEGVSMSSFERLLIAHIDTVCVHMCSLLCSQQGGDNNIASLGSPTSLSAAVPPVSQDVASMLSMDFWAHFIDRAVDMTESLQQAPEQLSTLARQATSDSSGGVSISKLWQEVVQNLLKGAGSSQRRIVVGIGEVKAAMDEAKKARLLTACALSAQSGTAAMSASEPDIVIAFSCGHVFAVDTLVRVALPDFTRALATAGVPPESRSILADAYDIGLTSTSGRCLQLGCPSCVAKALLQ